MDVISRNNVVIKGSGTSPMMFAHGFGCDQNMWRFITPAFEDSYQIILFDHVGAGKSDLKAYHPAKYKDLDGYTQDIIEIAEKLNLEDIIFIGHSVSAMMGILSAEKAPHLFKTLILVSPSASYINDGDYTGGFSKSEIDELLESLNTNHMGWSMTMAPLIMANPGRSELGEELTDSFCRTDPAIAQQFARVTFLTDSRSVLSTCTIPALILQCSDDIIAPIEVGEYIHEKMDQSKLVILEATGHCPHLSAPEETISAIKAYL
ncbi:sigma-B regulation protein RsbQ [Pedobacter cryoconitis]|uniref:Sigma-B regulation protein RsbQ n=1 Tax=Pedobacter cryoconitis TaxID=188932 RepID=A0A7W8ZNE7_9SPHI|nr:alpha/beta hydrolase [Pedobacter cryoconitis]MBB5637063.1 sigma-B regulation protein RsbQ [Pedobacter cryoconitis]